MGRKMENDINGWLTFARDVEDQLGIIDDRIFSKSYKGKLIDLLEQIRTEASLVANLSLIEKQESYIRINSLGRELKTEAYFAR